MKKKIICGILILGTLISLTGCQTVAKNLGGTTTVDLDENRKLIECTWKEDSLWFLTKEMKEDDIAETYEFKESSNFGIIEGTVIIKEHKTEEKK